MEMTSEQGPILAAFIDESELAKELHGIHKRTLWRWRQAGTGPKFFRIGKRIYYKRETVNAWLENLCNDSRRAN